MSPKAAASARRINPPPLPRAAAQCQAAALAFVKAACTVKPARVAQSRRAAGE